MRSKGLHTDRRPTAAQLWLRREPQCLLRSQEPRRNCRLFRRLPSQSNRQLTRCFQPNTLFTLRWSWLDDQSCRAILSRARKAGSTCKRGIRLTVLQNHSLIRRPQQFVYFQRLLSLSVIPQAYKIDYNYNNWNTFVNLNARCEWIRSAYLSHVRSQQFSSYFFPDWFFRFYLFNILVFTSNRFLFSRMHIVHSLFSAIQYLPVLLTDESTK